VRYATFGRWVEGGSHESELFKPFGKLEEKVSIRRISRIELREEVLAALWPDGGSVVDSEIVDDGEG
jgi:hypothetical protein|tara:strand:+ start:1920 stop:2120 length:201 start_codon:yes stop_codon:yes gene_type:complete